ncbi:hypothetical protein D9615_001225 [Tricholomella constricta]|uniref:Lethal giant larvae (Lgl)-like C-terminal domain-containing protein n=1 Tax=Tricholomella constricta TaxID=117010 RepID=A0A8H5M9D0_9AGAR|nr:hypothetical protein D9615_001225 [Tricholomella constricta]
MFRRHSDVVYIDLSMDLRDPDDWKAGSLRTFEYPLNITTLATEPISGLLAIGTAGGVVYIFGSPGVETRLSLPDPVGVRFLQFAPSTFQLACLGQDYDGNMLHIWDLSSYGRPKLARSSRFDPINSLTLSPCHSHAFLALNSGEIRTYDLLCLRKSPYIMPNLWKPSEDKLSANGVPYTQTRESLISVEIVIHPRDLNRLFVAYGGGVVLADLTKRSTVRSYELVLPPGAPGGFGYGSRVRNPSLLKTPVFTDHLQDLLTYRRPEVTALAIHPAGHFFVVGHADGSLSFWAVEDEETPLLVRTLDELDVHTVDAEKLDEHVFRTKQAEVAPPAEREPIFKLSWSGFSNSSDPRGGKTTLAILGGLNPGEAAGLTVIQLPAFNPPEPPASTSIDPKQPFLHPVMRQAMRDSLNPLESYFYFTQGVVQDYLLIPQKSPHFAGTFDPIAVLLLTEGKGATRTIEALQYPPPEFTVKDLKSPAPGPQMEAKKDALESLADDLADTLQSLQQSDEPRRLMLPPALLNGSSGLLDGQLLKLNRETYQTLVQGTTEEGLHLPLKGGQAWAIESRANDLKIAKYQPHRILITHYRDMTVQFSDTSAQLLIGLQPTPLQTSLPNSLPDLTIDLKPVLLDSVVLGRTSSTLIDHARIEFVHFATEALETTVVLQSGEVILYRLSGPRNVSSYRDLPDEELIILSHIPNYRGFSPYFMLNPKKGPSEACAVSDIGFVAVAYHNVLYIVNMRGPQVAFRYVDGKLTRGKVAGGLISGRADSDPVTSLLWTISEVVKDPEQRVRLVAMRASGQYQIYTLTQTDSSTQSWVCEGPITADGGVSQVLPRGAFVIDSKSGAGVTANRSRLAGAGYGQKTPPVLVMVGTKGARCFANLNGERIGKVDWGSKVGTIQGVQIVEKLGSHVLVVTTDRHDALVYSLPQLEYMLKLKLPPVSSSSLTLDETGDFVAWTPHSSGTIDQATYGTLFDIRRVYEPPDIDFLSTKPVVPVAPQPVSAGPASLLQLGSWFPFNQSMTGTQLDELLGGPDRPIPQPERQQRDFLSGTDLAAGASGVAAAAAATQSNLYSRISSALNERGQVLSDLEERFNALEEGSKNMVSQAKRLATQQTAKSWFGL